MGDSRSANSYIADIYTFMLLNRGVRSCNFVQRVFKSSPSLAMSSIAPGTPYKDIETPSLLLMMDQFEGNLARMQKRADAMGVNLRPHAKSLKSSFLGKMQVSEGAVGLCAAKVTEVEKLINGGINDVLLTNEVVDRSKLERLANLLVESNKSAPTKLGICVDNPRNIEMIQSVFSAVSQKIDIYIEIDVGQGRCGVKPGEACADLAEKVLSFGTSSALSLKGIQAYSGWNQHIQEVSKRITATENGPILGVKQSLEAIHKRGIPIDGLVITGGGTGTYTLEGGSGGDGSNRVYTEIQPGSYSVMDGEYGKTEPVDKNRHYDNALYVITSVMSDSSTHPAWVVVDAGDKAVHPGSAGITVCAADYDPTTGQYLPSDHARSKLTYRRGGDEHGIIEGPEEVLKKLPIGTKLLLIPGHCDPTINFYDTIVCCRSDGIHGAVVEQVVPIEARGPGV